MKIIGLNDNSITEYYELEKHLTEVQHIQFRFDHVSRPILIGGNHEPFYKPRENYHIIKCNYQGGLIICKSSDILFLYVDTPHIQQQVINRIKHFIDELNSHSTHRFSLENNDIIVDGLYKIGSRAGGLHNGVGVIGVFLSNTDSEKEIGELCTKDRKYKSTNFNKLNIDKKWLNDAIQKCFSLERN